MSTKALAIVVGAGPGLGCAVARALAVQRGMQVAILSRTKSKLDDISKSIASDGGEVEAFECDVTSEASVQSAFAAIEKRFNGPLRVACFNANQPFIRRSALEISVAEYEAAFAVNGSGAFIFARESIKRMLASQKDGETSTLIFTGATAALRGGANFAAFSPSKFALRALSQNLAREFAPKGIHVIHTIIDGIILTDRTVGMMGQGDPGKRLLPDSIASTYLHLIEQPRDCWTQELDMRPMHETW